MKPSDQEIATHEACGHYLYRDWCRTCVGGTGRSDAHKRRHEEQNSVPLASMDDGFFTDGDDSEHTREATPFVVVKVKPSMMIWSARVRCKGVEDQAAIKETVESLTRLRYPELIVRSDTGSAMFAFRDAVIRESWRNVLVSEQSQKLHRTTILRQLASWKKRRQTGQGESANPGDCDTGVARCCHEP